SDVPVPAVAGIRDRVDFRYAQRERVFPVDDNGPISNPGARGSRAWQHEAKPLLLVQKPARPGGLSLNLPPGKAARSGKFALPAKCALAAVQFYSCMRGEQIERTEKLLKAFIPAVEIGKHQVVPAQIEMSLDHRRRNSIPNAQPCPARARPRK